VSKAQQGQRISHVGRVDRKYRSDGFNPISETWLGKIEKINARQSKFVQAFIMRLRRVLLCQNMSCHVPTHRKLRRKQTGMAFGWCNCPPTPPHPAITSASTGVALGEPSRAPLPRRGDRGTWSQPQACCRRRGESDESPTSRRLAGRRASTRQSIGRLLYYSRPL
jgi:hypothetical protein